MELTRSSQARWGQYADLFDLAVEFALQSLANEDDGLLNMNRRRTMLEVIGLLGEEINDARREDRGVDPEIVVEYVQQIIDRASFPARDRPPVFYVGMPEPPTDRDLRVFFYRPRSPSRPKGESDARHIAYVVGEVVGRFDLNTHVSADIKPSAQHKKPSAVQVVAAALSLATNRRRASQSTVRACLTPERSKDFDDGCDDGRAAKALAGQA